MTRCPIDTRRRPLPALTGWVLFVLALLFATGCATNRFEQPRPGTTQRGIASWYGEPFHGRATASGEIYDMHGMTAAHKELPLGTVVDVLNLENGRRTRVRVNDRGPFIRGRIIDLSYGAAKVLGVVGPGTAKVEIEVVSLGSGPSGPNMATRYTVQLGAFGNVENARRLHRELLEHYSEAKMVKIGNLHRVRIGSFGRQKEAEALRQELARRGYSALVLALN